jgi:hypothetical protein
MKATASYKMSKENKTILSQITDSHKKGEIKRIFIESDLIAASRPKRDKKLKEQPDD